MLSNIRKLFIITIINSELLNKYNLFENLKHNLTKINIKIVKTMNYKNNFCIFIYLIKICR